MTCLDIHNDGQVKSDSQIFISMLQTYSKRRQNKKVWTSKRKIIIITTTTKANVVLKMFVLDFIIITVFFLFDNAVYTQSKWHSEQNE